MYTAQSTYSRICAFDVMNSYGLLEDAVEVRFRELSDEGLLWCEDCGGRVVYKHGVQKRPHFSHKQVTPECVQSMREKLFTPEHEAGVAMLYHFFREIDGLEVEVDRKLGNGRRANLYLKKLLSYDPGTDSEVSAELAVEYINKKMTRKSWAEKEADYEDAGIPVLYILNRKYSPIDDGREKGVIEQALQFYRKDKVLHLLDVEQKTLGLALSVELRNQYKTLMATQWAVVEKPLDQYIFTLPEGFDRQTLMTRCAQVYDFLAEKQQQKAEAWETLITDRRALKARLGDERAYEKKAIEKWQSATVSSVEGTQEKKLQQQALQPTQYEGAYGFCRSCGQWTNKAVRRYDDGTLECTDCQEG